MSVFIMCTPRVVYVRACEWGMSAFMCTHMWCMHVRESPLCACEWGMSMFLCTHMWCVYLRVSGHVRDEYPRVGYVIRARESASKGVNTPTVHVCACE